MEEKVLLLPKDYVVVSIQSKSNAMPVERIQIVCALKINNGKVIDKFERVLSSKLCPPKLNLKQINVKTPKAKMFSDLVSFIGEYWVICENNQTLTCIEDAVRYSLSKRISLPYTTLSKLFQYVPKGRIKALKTFKENVEKDFNITPLNMSLNIHFIYEEIKRKFLFKSVK